MVNSKRPAAPEADEVDEIRRHVAALTDASMKRHRLLRGTPEYEVALETEEELADRVWQLGAALPPLLEHRPERTPTRQTRKKRTR